MAETEGVQSGFPYDEDRDGIRFKPQIHRPGLTFQPEGFVFTMNKSAQVADTDYTPCIERTQLAAAASASDTTITVDNTRYMSESMIITLDPGGANDEDVQVKSVDPATNVVTLVAGVTNAHAIDTDIEGARVLVSYDSDKQETTVDFFLVGQNATEELSGCDVQFGYGRAGKWPTEGDGFNNLDGCHGLIVVPYFHEGLGSFIYFDGPEMCHGQYAVEPQKEIPIDARESASAVDPNYILRITFKSVEETPTVKKVNISLGIWRAP